MLALRLNPQLQAGRAANSRIDVWSRLRCHPVPQAADSCQRGIAACASTASAAATDFDAADVRTLQVRELPPLKCMRYDLIVLFMGFFVVGVRRGW